MSGWFRGCFRRGYGVLALCLVFASLALPGWRSLELRVSSEDLIATSSADRVLQREADGLFGASRHLVVMARPADGWSLERVSVLRDLQEELRRLPGVERVESLFTSPSISGSFGSVRTSAYLARLPRSDEAVREVLGRAAADPMMVGRLISQDARSVALYVVVGGGPEAEKRAVVLAGEVESVLRRVHGGGLFETLLVAGGPSIQSWMQSAIIEDQRRLLPVAAGVLALCMGLLLRSGSAVSLTLLNTAITTVVAFGIAGWLGWPITLLGALTPLLVLIIGASQDIHVVSEFQHARRHGLPGGAAVADVAQGLALPLVLTGVTTALGFGVNLLSDLPLIEGFGRLAALAMLVRLVLTLTLSVAWLRIWPPRVPKPGIYVTDAVEGFSRAQRESTFVIEQFVRRPRRSLVAFALVAIPCVALMPRIEFRNDLLSLISPEAPPRQALAAVEAELGPFNELRLVLRRMPGDFRRPELLQTVQALMRELEADKRVYSVTGLPTFLAQIHSAMVGGGTGGALPDSSSLLAQYFLFFHRSDLSPWVSHDFATLCLSVRTGVTGSRELGELADFLEDRARALGVSGSGYAISPSLQLARSTDAMAVGQALSLVLLCGLLWLIVASLFVSVKAGLLALGPNLFSIAVLFGVMALAGIPLNAGTSLVAAIAMGIAVDDTLHLMTRYHRALKRLNDEQQGIEVALHAEFFPATVTTLSLVAGFAVLGFSSFVPVQQFGLLSAGVLVTALVADLVLTPVLLGSVHLLTVWDVVGVRVRRQLQASSDLLRGFTSWQVKELVLLSRLQEFRAGDRLIEQGAAGKHLYLLLEGELEVSRRDPELVGGGEVMARLGPGAVVGEIALVGNVPRLADVACLSDARLLSIAWEDLEKLRRRSPRLSGKLLINLARVLAQRLKATVERQVGVR